MTGVSSASHSSKSAFESLYGGQIINSLDKTNYSTRRGPSGIEARSPRLPLSRSQSPQALLPAVGRQERLWRIRKKLNFGLAVP